MRSRGWLRCTSIPAVVSLLAMLLIVLPGSGVFAAVGVTNGDFESGATGWAGIGSQFGIVAHTAVVTSFTQGATTINPQHGTQFVEADSFTQTSFFGSSVIIDQDVPITPGGTFTGYYYFIPDSGATPNANAALQVITIECNPNNSATCVQLGSPTTQVNRTTATNGWLQFSFTVPANTTANKWELQLNMSCPGGTSGCPNAVAAFDNIVFTPLPAVTQTAVSPATASYSAQAQNVTLNATVTSGSSVNEGTVTFTVKDGSNNTVGSPVTSGTVASGAASATFSLPGSTAAGSYTVNAVYNPASANFNTSSGSGTLTVSTIFPTVTVPTVTAAFSSGTQFVTLTANFKFDSGASNVNEGSAKFQLRQGLSTNIGTAVTGPVAGGVASVNYSLPAGQAVGNYFIDVTYNPAATNPNFKSIGNSGTLNIVANPTPGNGVQNADFEAGVTNWSGFGTGGSPNQFDVVVHTTQSPITVNGVALNPHGGSKFGEMNTITGGHGPAVLYQNILVQPGGTLSGWYNFVPDGSPSPNANAALQITLYACDPSNPAQCVLANPTVSFTPVNVTTATNGWKQFTFTFPTNQQFTMWQLDLILTCPTAGGTQSCGQPPANQFSGPWVGAAAAFDDFTYLQPTTSVAATNTTTPYSSAAQNVTLNATVTAGSPVNEGTVTFTVKQGATTIGSPVTSGTVTNSAATATYVLPADTLPGAYTIAVTYNSAPSNPQFQPSSGTGTLTVAPAATNLAVTNTTTPASFSAQNVTLNATISATSPVNEGTVTFTVKQGATTIGAPVTSGTVAAGLASVSYALPASTAPGTYSIVAVYNPAASTPRFQTSTNTGSLGVSGTLAVTLTGLSVVTPSPLGNPPIMKVGQQAQLAAIATFSDGSTADVTTQAQWSSGSPDLVKVDATGKVIAQSGSRVTITATYTASGVTQTATTVITVTPPTPIGIDVQAAPQPRSAGGAGATSNANAPSSAGTGTGTGAPAPIPAGR